MNLINDPWIPIRRRDGSRQLIAPWQITDNHKSNPVMAVDAPRADFNGALMQFLIGLLQTTADLEDNEDWRGLLEEPLSPEELQAQFAPIAHAFELNGDGPRFMQALNDLPEGTEFPIAALLIEAPGENALKNNTDHFIKRGGVQGMCPACAATALFTLQTNAPGGGAGHRTSLRGGGPLTTLVIFDPKTAQDDLGATLWRNLWLNVLDKPTFSRLGVDSSKIAPADIFPWLAPTRTSEPKTGRDTTPAHIHPAQMFWGMPRRIRLRFDNALSGRCDVCGGHSDTLVSHYITKNYGINYTGPWKHPLSPYSRNKDGTPLPLHPQPGGLSYRHWLGLVQAQGESRERAKVVDAFFERKEVHSQFRVWAFGYDMDNMKARCWYESTMPLYELDAAHRKHFEVATEHCINGAGEVKFYLVSALKEAWFERPGDVRGDMSFIAIAFWQNTEDAFYNVLYELAYALKQGAEPKAAMNQAKQRWYLVIRQQGLNLFDQWAVSGVLEYENPRRIAEAHNKLVNQLGSKKLREKILALPLKTKTDEGASYANV